MQPDFCIYGAFMHERGDLNGTKKPPLSERFSGAGAEPYGSVNVNDGRIVYQPVPESQEFFRRDGRDAQIVRKVVDDNLRGIQGDFPDVRESVAVLDDVSDKIRDSHCGILPFNK